MKTDSRRMASLLRDLDRLHVVCLHGDDPDHVHASARRLVVAAAGAEDDPFRVTLCDGEQREAIECGLASPPLSGGRAVVWVRHAGERLAPVVAASLAGSTEVLLVVEYPAATARSKLRLAVEHSPRGCLVGCYVQPDATLQAVQAALAALAVEAGHDVVTRLAEIAAATQRSGQQIGELAALAVGQGRRLERPTLEALFSVLPGSGDSGLGAALNCGMLGDGARLDAAVAESLAEGSAVGVVRGALLHLQRLRAMAAQIETGVSLAEAGRSLRPPLYYREEKTVAEVLRRWTPARLDAACRAIEAAERATKTTGVPQDAICREVLGRLSHASSSGGMARVAFRDD